MEHVAEIDYDAVFLRNLMLLNNGRTMRCVKIPVLVNLYEISPALSGTKKLGIPVLHSATELFGYEIAYGGSKTKGTGIYIANPLTMPHPAKFYKEIKLGETHFSSEQVIKLIRDNMYLFPGEEYSLLQNNCNHFTQWLVHHLCGASLPSWVNRIANVGATLTCFGCGGELAGGVGPQVERII